MQIDGHTRLAAVVANPIKHSISPFIHNSAFEKTQVNGVYVAWEIPGHINTINLCLFEGRIMNEW